MNLKKNDKIILIVGVVILVVAGVGIALYSAPESDENVGEPSDEVMTYTYTWEQHTGEKVIGESLNAGKNSPYEDTFMVSSGPNTVITNVDLNLVWKDDYSYGLLVKRGLDTLSAEISLDDETKTESSKGSGNFTFFYTVNSRPDDSSVEARDLTEAKTNINNIINGGNEASFDATVTVNTGERFWHLLHLLKVIRDKGNDFELTATYTYYEYNIQAPENSDNDESNSGDDTKETGDDGNNHNVGEFYVNLGYGRGMI